MREGKELICKLSKLRWWNRTKSSYNNKLAELDASLKGLLKHIVIQQARDIKENLFVARETTQQLIEFQRFNERLLRERTLLQKDAKDLQEKLLLALFNNGKQLLNLQDLIEGMMKPQEASQEASQVTDGGKGDLVGLYKALFESINQLLKENVKNNHFKQVLKNIKSTITSLEPLVAEIKESYESLFFGQKRQVHRLTRQMRDGLELLHECSQLSTWNIYKRLSCASKLIQWDEYVQNEIDLLVVKLKGDEDYDEKSSSVPSTRKAGRNM